ncbi:zinc ABC transporter substrate-binding protein [Hoeflea sp. WL0058]|uniref:High-affinity zinc uptake system protein ZnuA n=1 Tax=Flavimaribacter sediminis TaxID=2865987 RepID=A0AAE2ZGM3_9HYPH|nr:zinc ABC transporter substrate-binding protein [Flavimaribacter sediminis]MBW8636229.1 zinc ABC transporter substrate-binding protein [Flavimaribacter sediminis]
MSIRLALPVLAAAGFLSTTALADVKVVASIKPVHSLVASIMEGAGSPEILVDGAASPHTYSLKPSQARSLADADVVFWVGPSLEPFLEKPLETIAEGSTSVALDDAPGLALLDVREGGAFEEHDHDHEGHDDHAEHDHDDHDGHDDHEEHDDEKHEEAGHEGEGHDHDDHDNEKHAHEDHDGHHSFDPHIWLDPVNASAMADAIAASLQMADPENAALYAENLATLKTRLNSLIEGVAPVVEPVKQKPFIVFHDAYHYFENRFGLSAAGSITISPEVSPGAARISEIREKVSDLKAVCVFSEPQFESSLVGAIIEGTDAKTAVLDPLGAELANGPDLYFSLIGNMADSMADCLG